MRYIIGIDPGRTGGICCMFGPEILLTSMPDNAVELADLLRIYAEQATDIHVLVEKAQCLPKNGSVGMFRYGTGYGTILGIIAALRLSHTLVHPNTWCKEMHRGTKSRVPKKRSLEAAQRLYPHVSLMRTVRCKAPDEGYVDAMLIAGYGKRILGW
jgi:hypothetical protein